MDLRIEVGTWCFCVCVRAGVVEMSHGREWDGLHQCQRHRLGLWSQKAAQKGQYKASFSMVKKSVNVNYCIFGTVGRGELAMYANLSSSRRKFIHSGGLSMGRRYSRNARGG